ncbi:MAG TPA: hypothetical protein VKI00_16195 [Mycobacterium sp.]|uniref:hypothetical protein n=1 Tax=Mycobacterium sp. TaxID=1785 RepID=UPI002B8A5C5E|nr:hypothetical protein [Mycobacterium sp.]HME77124.1 hypothetical protein [Mycobacterium sp.]
MPSRKRPSEALAAHHGDAPREVTDSDGGQPSSEPTGEAPASLEQAGLRRPRWKAVAVGAAIVLICASLGASGYMVWHHRTVLRERHLAAEFSAAARQSVVTLMSVDPDKAREYVQRVIDNSTGNFKEDLQATADDLTRTMEQSKASTRVNVDAVAVESMTDDSAVVLVAAKSDLTDSEHTKRDPGSWRISITLKRDGGQLKISKVEFV